MKFTCVILQVQYESAYPLGIYGNPNSIELCIVPLFHGFVLCVEIKVGIYGVITS